MDNTEVADSNDFTLPGDCVEEALPPSVSPAPTPSSAELPFRKAGIYMKGGKTLWNILLGLKKKRDDRIGL